MHFLIDADLPRSVKPLIERYGHDATDVRDIGLASAKDPQIAVYAQSRRVCLITGDFGFADIRNYVPAAYAGIVVLELPRNATAAFIVRLVEFGRVGQDPPYTVEQSVSRQKKHEQPVWQRRFWEHTVRNEDEVAALCDYIHYNPVKYGYARCPHAWPHSSFHRFVHAKLYPQDWLCVCKGARRIEPDFGVDDDIVGE